MTTAVASGPAGHPGTAIGAANASAALTVAAFASIGAGAIHATAVGVHGEHRAAAVAFALLAAVQLGWGAVALTGPGRLACALGGAANAVAVGGWFLAKASGIAFVDGLETAEDPQLADTTAAVLAALAAAGAFTAVVHPRPRTGASRLPRPALVTLAAVTALVVTPAMVSAGGHSHAGGDAHAHGADPATPGHDHAGSTAGEGAAAVAPVPYDPNRPIDLGGVEGVTPEQQARAENLIAVTLLRLPKFADPAVAEANGYRSIGDGVTGYEHYVNQALFDDGRILDPDHPESVVYQRDPSGGKRLVAAMYMLEPDKTLDDVPDIGGKLTQWHVHNDLCFRPEGTVAGFTRPDGSCPAPLQKFTAPMIHVWIVPHRCGPFAALEGVAGGQIAEGEERLCDHAHGSH
ncbi:MAG: hypothetical protein KatS3mg009_0609 [Acidimicrobiia bacterium]|nr:MAG: hypothetical protein KatS3mg009_0609 [Acidimicrobiia bacterium]